METIIKNYGTHPRTELRDKAENAVKEAARIVAPYWPISTFIASNGLTDLENRPFEEAMRYAGEMRGSQGFLPLASYREYFNRGRINETDLEGPIENLLEERGLPRTISLTDHPVAATSIFMNWMTGSAGTSSKSEELREVIARRARPFLRNMIEPATATIETAGEHYRLKNGQTVIEAINQRMITWCASFLDDGQAAWSMPGREKGFYTCWKELAALDPSLPGGSAKPFRKKLKTMPADPTGAIIMLLKELNVPETAWPEYLTRHIAELPGWAGLIRWRQEHPEVAAQQERPINLAEYLAARLCYEAAMITAGKKITRDRTAGEDQAGEEIIARLAALAGRLSLRPGAIEQISTDTFEKMVRLAYACDTGTQQRIWQEAFEGHYRRQLMQDLVAAQSKPSALSSHRTPAAQVFFCIDVRSEGFRRHLEKLGAYETLGFAGFFGVPMLYQPFGASCNLTLGPALISVTQPVREVPKNASPEQIERRMSMNGLRYKSGKLVHTLRENLLTPFAFVEMFGWLFFFPLVAKTLAPGTWRKARRYVEAKMTPPVPTEPSIISDTSEMSLEAQAKAVAGMLRSTGLTRNFARLVLVCGHGSDTENNPYASALDCGACGGNHGGLSAYVAASILNTRPVRRLLAEQGIVIPAETFFVAGEHNTTTDEITFMNEAQVPASHRDEFEQLKRDLAEAGERNAAERQKRLPGGTKKAQERAADWSQVRPEWGLVRNAAFICGRRSLTAGLNLDNRTFLHSYDPHQDVDGSILEGILTAPVVVAEWINMQYYLSSVDNAQFGSSTKLLHTVVGQVGVMQGHQSDLLTGLPQQSVMLGETLYHEPMRLFVVVEAPPARIESIIGRHERLQKLTRNRWINLAAYDHVSKTFYHYMPDGKWMEAGLDSRAVEEEAA